MKHQVFTLLNMRWPALGLLFSIIALVGCEYGNKVTSTPVQQNYPTTPPKIMAQDNRIETLNMRLLDEPENDALLAALGDAYFEQGRFPEAIPVYERAVTINPDDFDTLNDLGLAYFYTGNADAALTSLDKSAAAKPDYNLARMSKGFVLLSIGQYEEAEVSLRKAKELDTTGRISAEVDNLLRKMEEMKAAVPNKG